MLEAWNKAFENKVRLSVMSLLMVRERLDFPGLKTLLNLTDGNLASHLAALERLGYIQVDKRFIGKKPNTSYRATQAGRSAFLAHLDVLEKFLRGGV
ncbi:MAG: hypothetical protein RLY31_304 [Bacteroidota bacterium]|jgi:DNA-binding HxlR family transcriptional regulator